MSAITGSDELLSSNERCISAWLARNGVGNQDAAPEELPRLYLAGLRAVWLRALPCLGEVVLGAIVARIIARAEARHEGLSRVGLRIHEQATIEMVAPAALTPDLTDAIKLTLLDLLDALDLLTARTITPALHAALTAATSEAGVV